MENIPDIYWPGVFQYQDSNRTIDGSYTWISFIDYQPDTDYIKDTHIDHSKLFCSNSSFATQCYTSGSEIWDLHAKLGLFSDQIWTLVPVGTKSQIWDFIIAPADLFDNLGLLFSPHYRLFGRTLLSRCLYF